MKKITICLISFLLISATGISSLAALEVNDYLENKFPAIFTFYLASLEDLDEDEIEFIDILETIPAFEQRIFAREVYEQGFSLDLLERIKNWNKRVEMPFLKIAYPGQDGLKVRGNPIFVFGSTTPSPQVRVIVNGEEVKKIDYRSGNFLTLINLPEGIEYPIKITASLNGEEASITRNVIYQPVWKEMPFLPLAIHSGNVLPKEDQIIEKGDLLRVIIQGSPFARASFIIGNKSKEIAMEEIETSSPVFSGRGIYVGSYLVGDSDIPEKGQTEPQTITVVLTRGSEQISRSLPGKIIFSSAVPVRTMEVVAEKTKFYKIREDSVNLPGSTLGGGSWLSELIGFNILPGTLLNITGKAGDYYRFKLGAETYLVHQNDVKELKELKNVETSQQKYLSKITIEENGLESNVLFHDIKGIPFLVEDETQQLTLSLYGVRQSGQVIINGQSSLINSIGIVPHFSEQGFDFLSINIIPDHPLAGFNYYWNGSHLTISLKKIAYVSKTNPLQGRTIVIDPGHGGNSPGAIGPGPLNEKDLVLEIGKFLQELLESQGARVIMTRSQDINVNLQERIDIGLEQGADLFVSIHANAHAEGADAVNYHGHMILYNYNYNLKLAEIMLESLVKRTGLPATRVWKRPDLVVLRETQLPALLVETGYLMHPDDNWFLLQPEYQRILAQGIMDGIRDYFFSLTN